MISFKLIKSEYIDDVKSQCFYYKHSSGAKILYLKNDDIEKVFTVAFRTEPENNCGTPHIVEHCTLCGSQNYKLKDPFNVLDKGAIHTYLNAITYQDKTVYPVAGTVEKDFMTMMKVYLDGIFKPLMLKNKGIFQQEGWHIGENGINGVVYNEMKGVFSLPNRALKHKLQAKFYRGSSYEFYSGGIPEYIPKLTYESFVDFYKRKYHPSNAVFYLYGKLEIERYFELLDKYIGDYTSTENKLQHQINPDYSDLSFNIYNNNKNYLMAMFNTGNVYDYKKNLSLKILTQALFNNNSDLKEKLLKAGAVVKGEFDNSCYFSDLTIYIEDSIITLSDFKHIIQNFAVGDNIPKKFIEAAINSIKFYISEEDYGYKPKGLYYGLDLLNGFLYNNEDFTPIKYAQLFKDIENTDFNALFREIVKNGVYGEIDSSLLAKKTVIKNMPANNEALINFQKQEDALEELNKISTVNISEISKDIYKLNSVVNKNIIYTPINSDIVYVDFSFDISNIKQDLIEFIGVYRYVAQRINDKLSEKIKLYMGDLNFSFSTFSKNNSYIPVLILRAKFLKEHTENALACIKELLFDIDFTDLNKINSLVKEQKQIMNKSLVSNGNFFAVNYALSCCNERYKFSEMLTGVDYLEFLSNNMQTEIISENLAKIKQQIFNKKNCTISYGCLPNEQKNILNGVLKIYNNLSDALISHKILINKNQEMAIYINSFVNYNALIGEIPEFNGYYKVIRQIINSYLWDNVRIKGGAYTSNCDFYRSGYFKLSSYRDPNIKETFEAFHKIPQWICELSISDKELNRYITGTISSMDMPIKNNTKTIMALNNYFSGLTDEKLMLERQQVLETNLTYIKSFGEKINIVNGQKCSVGNEKIISNSKLYNKFSKFC